MAAAYDKARLETTEITRVKNDFIAKLEQAGRQVPYIENVSIHTDDLGIMHMEKICTGRRYIPGYRENIHHIYRDTEKAYTDISISRKFMPVISREHTPYIPGYRESIYRYLDIENIYAGDLITRYHL
jgi:hypothetical protein